MNFYTDHLALQDNGTLPRAVTSALDGRLGMFEDRLASLLYKHSVELDMVMGILADNWDGVQQSDIYVEYIATRPGVERLGSHGLFGDEDYVDLKKVTAELQSCKKNVWTHVVSLKRKDAVRLGYDNARSWRNLLRRTHNMRWASCTGRVKPFPRIRSRLCTG